MVSHKKMIVNEQIFRDYFILTNKEQKKNNNKRNYTISNQTNAFFFHWITFSQSYSSQSNFTLTLIAVRLVIFGISGVESPRSESFTSVSSLATFVTFAGPTVDLDLGTAVDVSRTFVGRNSVAGWWCSFVRSVITLGIGHGDDDNQKNELKTQKGLV